MCKWSRTLSSSCRFAFVCTAPAVELLYTVSFINAVYLKPYGTVFIFFSFVGNRNWLSNYKLAATVEISLQGTLNYCPSTWSCNLATCEACYHSYARISVIIGGRLFRSRNFQSRGPLFCEVNFLATHGCGMVLRKGLTCSAVGRTLTRLGSVSYGLVLIGCDYSWCSRIFRNSLIKFNLQHYFSTLFRIWYVGFIPHFTLNRHEYVCRIACSGHCLWHEDERTAR